MTTQTLPDGIHTTTPVDFRGNRRYVIWADLPYVNCPGCGQTVGYEVPDDPVVLSDTRSDYSEIIETDKKHGCGEWLSVMWREVEDEDAIENAAHTLADDLSEEIEALRDKTRQGLTVMLRKAKERLGEPLDEQAGETAEDRDAEVLGGNEVTPGVYRDGGLLVAWDYDPAGRDSEPITVTEDDLE